MGLNLVLQPSEYIRMVEEQAKTRASGREVAFASCGMVSRIRDLKFSGTPQKLKSLLTGNIIAGTDDCLSLSDFESRGFPIATGRQPDVRSNENLATTLRNLEAVMVVYFSAAFLGVFTEVLKNIEGFARPLELVSADFLKHSVEIVLSKFFRVTRSQKHSYDPSMLMCTPQLCAANLSSFINSLVRDLSDDAERARMEEFYLLHLRIEESSNKALTRSAAKLSNDATANVPQSSDSQAQTVGAVATDTLICGSHLGGLLKAIHSKTKTVFACKAGESCKFEHVTIEGKSKKDILGLIATLPPVMRTPLITAAASRK